MSDDFLFYQNIARSLLKEDKVQEGKMMSAQALKYNNKVFVFYHEPRMGFRLGPDTDIKKLDLAHIEPLSPFKTKPPLKGWYLVGAEEKNKWAELSEMALRFTKTLK